MGSSKKSANLAVLERAGGGTPAGEMVDRLVGEGYTRDEAIGAIIGLRARRMVAVDEARPYAGVVSYAFSPYSLWFWAAFAAVAASVALISVSSGVILYARYVFGGALVLFLPGYGLVEALYPKRGTGAQVERAGAVKADMDDDLTRFALSIGLSLAIVPLTGLVLNYTPFGIRLIPVVLSIAGLTVAFLCAALYRKHQYYRLAKGVV